MLKPILHSPACEHPQQDATPTRRGFTLIELMAATGIMVVIILLVLSLTTSVLNSWNDSSAQLAQNYEARVAMDLLAKDLQTMRLRSDGMAWLQVQQEPLSGNAGPAGNESFTSMYFFSPVIDRPTETAGGVAIPGDLCAVSYRIAYKNPFTDGTATTDRPQYGLYRTVVDAENTFNIGLALDDYSVPTHSTTSLYALWTGPTAGGTLTAEGISSGKTLAEWSVSGDNYLSANVVEFNVKFFYEATDAAGEKVVHQMPDEFVYTSKSYPTPTNLGAGERFSRLSYAEIRMVVLGDDGAQIVANGGADSFSETEWDQFKRTHGKSFTRRVYVFANPI